MFGSHSSLPSFLAYCAQSQVRKPKCLTTIYKLLLVAESVNLDVGPAQSAITTGKISPPFSSTRCHIMTFDRATASTVVA